MERKRYVFYLTAVLLILVIASALLLYENKKTHFPEKLGDMELKLHREGDVAISEIKNSHSARDNVNPGEAHIARYRSSTGNRATVYVTEAESIGRAVELVENMNLRMGGMFSKPETVEINGLKIYYTEGGGEYHYYFPKNNLVVWITLSNPDKSYQSMFMKNAIKSIGEQL